MTKQFLKNLVLYFLQASIFWVNSFLKVKTAHPQIFWDTVSNIYAMNSWISFWIVLIGDLKQSFDSLQIRSWSKLF